MFHESKIAIDVILICYNQERFINQAIQSIFDQKVKENIALRVIVADDSSDDNTMQIIKSVAMKSPYVVEYLPQMSNMGISKNYQRAFDVCSGDYIAILEGDDYWSAPHHIQQHVDFLEEYTDSSMSMNAITFLDDDSGALSKNKWNYPRSPYFVNVKEQIKKGNQLGNLSACVLRTSCLKKLPIELYDLPIADWMLGVMMAQWGTIGLLKESTSVYRLKASGVWAGKSRWRQHITMIREADIYDRFQKGKYHKEWQEFKQSCWRDVRHNWMHYLPGFFQKSWHWIKQKHKSNSAS